MPVPFKVVDPRNFKVTCTEDCWHNHILGEHPEMIGEEDRSEEAIRNPTFGIYQDKDYPNRNIYYLLDQSKKY